MTEKIMHSANVKDEKGLKGTPQMRKKAGISGRQRPLLCADVIFALLNNSLKATS